MTISVNVYRNPLSPDRREQFGVQCPQTLRQITIEQNGGASEWPFPTIAIVDGVPWNRGRWNEPLTDGMVVEFRSMVRGGGTSPNFVIGGLMIAAGAVAIATGAGIPLGVGLIAGGAGMMYAGYKIRGMPDAPSLPSSLSGESGSPTYSFGLGGNRIRINEPFPIVYGEMRVTPDLASKPYGFYAQTDDGPADDYVVLHFIFTYGDAIIDAGDISFGNSDISYLENITYEIAGPNTPLPGAYSDNVHMPDAINGSRVPTVEAVNYYINNSIARFYPAGYVVHSGSGNFSYTVTEDTIASGYIAIREGYSGVPPDGDWYFIANIVSSDVYGFNAAPESFSGASLGETITVADSVSNDGAYDITSLGSGFLANRAVIVSPGLTREDDSACSVYAEASGWGTMVRLYGPDKECLKIEWDVSFPGGLGVVNGDGSTSSRTIDFEMQALQADGTVLFTEEYSTSASSTKQEHRVTFTKTSATPIGFGDDVFIRMRRMTTEGTSVAIVDRCLLTRAKAYLGEYLSYPGMTKAMICARSTDQLSGDIANNVSAIVSRRIPIWNGSSWSEPAVTRSIAWALADICRNPDYGMGLADSLIDIDALLALDAVWDARGDYFDGVFDQTVTAWEALQKVARVGRAIPVLVNGRVTFVRDGEKTVRSAIFNPSNIAPGSLSIQYAFRKDSDPDGVELTWLNPETWQQDTVTVALPGLVGDPVRPEKVDLFGCTNLAQATREATYLARRMAYMRKTITWQTEMDGRLLMVGDMVAVAHDVPSWSQSGEVIGFTDNGATCDYLTSQALDWTAAGTKYALLKKRDGSVSGPHAATEITGGFRINDPAWVPDTTLEDGERTSFVFYAGTSQDVIITDISPAGDTTATITAVPYDARIHASGA